MSKRFNLMILFIMGFCFFINFQAKAENKIYIKVATALPKGNECYFTAEKFVELVNKYGNGKINAQFYSGGSIGGELDQINATIIDIIDVSINGTLPIQHFAEKYSFIASPFILKDYDHFKRIWKSPLGDQLRSTLLKKKIRAVGVFYRGLRDFTSNKPLNNVNDFKGLKLRLPQNPIYEKIYKSIGINIQEIALTELYLALKSGIAEAADGPLSQITSYKMYEVQKYLNISGHQVAVGLFCMSQSFYEKLSDADKKIVDKAANEALLAGDEFTSKQEGDFMNQLTKNGMTVIKTDMESVRKAVKPTIDELFKTNWNVTTWDEINKL